VVLQLVLGGCFDGRVLQETACAVAFANLDCDGRLVVRPELTLAPQDHITSTEPERNQVNIRFWHEDEVLTVGLRSLAERPTLGSQRPAAV
jgi:homoaconitase/3-isopropylmalate dehydratase large subunit